MATLLAACLVPHDPPVAVDATGDRMMTADQGVEESTRMAKNWSEGAFLVTIQGYEGDVQYIDRLSMGPNDTTLWFWTHARKHDAAVGDGRSDRWEYRFFAPNRSKEILHVFAYSNGSFMSIVVPGGLGSPAPRPGPSWTIDSDAAVSLAIRRSLTFEGILNRQDANMQTWLFHDNGCRYWSFGAYRGNGTGFGVDVDANRGAALEASYVWEHACRSEVT